MHTAKVRKYKMRDCYWSSIFSTYFLIIAVRENVLENALCV